MKKSILLALLVLLSGAGLRAADFWEKKEYKQWKPKDVHKMLTKSPWAQNVSLDAMRMRRGAFEDIEGGPTQDPGARGNPDQSQGGGGGFGGGSVGSLRAAASEVAVWRPIRWAGVLWPRPWGPAAGCGKARAASHQCDRALGQRPAGEAGHHSVSLQG